MRLLPAPRKMISHSAPDPGAPLGVASATTVAALVAFTIARRPAEAADGTVLGADRADAIAGQYIVVLKDAPMDRPGVDRVAVDASPPATVVGSATSTRPRCAASRSR